MSFDHQPFLKGELVELRPLRPDDLEPLYDVASDPAIWEQHAVPDRHARPVFERFFREALACGGSLVVVDNTTRQVIGASRFHGYDAENSEVEIGWTFLARSHWGGAYNGEVKRLMFAHAFRFVETVVLLIGPDNLRSQRAAEKVGGVRSGERPDASGRISFVYRITRGAES